MVNCLTNDKVPLDPGMNGWKWKTDENFLEKFRYEGNPLPEFDETNINLEVNLGEDEKR